MAASLPATALAQAGATPLQLIVPVPPGGSVDLTGRLLAENLPRTLKQVVWSRTAPAHRVRSRRPAWRAPRAMQTS
jgi:tripartite-type tricarboxylate transporter receptor subunit TctC